MNRRALALSLVAMVPAILLLVVIPAARASGVSDFWRGFLLGAGGFLMLAIAVVAILLARSSDKGKSG